MRLAGDFSPSEINVHYLNSLRPTLSDLEAYGDLSKLTLIQVPHTAP